MTETKLDEWQDTCAFLKIKESDWINGAYALYGWPTALDRGDDGLTVDRIKELMEAKNVSLQQFKEMLQWENA